MVWIFQQTISRTNLITVALHWDCSTIHKELSWNQDSLGPPSIQTMAPWLYYTRLPRDCKSRILKASGLMFRYQKATLWLTLVTLCPFGRTIDGWALLTEWWPKIAQNPRKDFRWCFSTTPTTMPKWTAFHLAIQQRIRRNIRKFWLEIL